MFLSIFGLSARAEIISFSTVGNDGKLIADELEFNKSIGDVAKSIDGYGLADVKINIVITPNGDNASFDYGNIVNIPRSMQFSNEYGADTVYKTTMDIISVFAHEYGHSVFDDHLGKAIPLHKELKKIKAEISDLLLKSIRSPLSAAEIAKIKLEIDQKEKSIAANKEYLRIMFLTMPYGELFADTVAVYTMNSKGAIYEALYNPSTPIYKRDEIAYVAARDFGQPHDIDTWTNDSDHGLFAPLRSVIGGDDCWPATDAQRAKKLSQLSGILVADILTKYQTGQKAVIEDNRNLMKKFKEFCNPK